MPPLKNKVIYLRPAREDMLDIARFHLEKVGVNSARKITSEIEETISRLTDFPLMGPIHPDPVLAASGYRKLVVSNPYVCVYKLFDDGVYIYRIVNGRMDYPRLLK